MRKWLAALVPLLASSTASSAPLAGRVVETRASWAYGHTAIVTESVLEKEDGSRVTLHQLGGSTEGIGMRQSHAPQLLQRGDEVLVETTALRTASGRSLHKLRTILDLRRQDAPEHEGLKGLEDSLEEGLEFVRTENSNGRQISWASGCAFLSVASEGSSHLPGDTEFEIIDEVLRTWQGAGESCSYFELINEGKEDREVGLDGINLIKFREDVWCRPATDDDPQECYEQAAAGLTTLFFIDDSGSSRNGEIIDADIEFNGVQFALSAGGQSSGSAQCKSDLANTLTHEVGHFLGLDHTCWTGGPRLEDDEGKTVPMCNSPNLSAEIEDATMYNFQSCGETKKATLESDDIAGMCAIYPAAEDPNSCERAALLRAGCCSVAGEAPSRAPGGAALLALLGFLAIALTRRRSQRRAP